MEIVAKDEAEWEAEQAEEAEKKRIKAEVERAQREAEAAVKDKGKGKEVDVPSSPTRTTAILDRLSTSTTQFQSTFQTTINNTLAAAKANPALADPTALRAKLAENLHLSSARENLTLSFQQAEKLAEEYLKKGGALVKDVQTKGGELVKDVQTKGETWVKDAEQWVEENVKLVAPPEEGQTFVSMGGWDGGDFYSFSTSSPTTEAAESRTPRASLSSAAIAGSRKEALLRRLREDKDLLMVDPAGEAETQERRDEFANWVKDRWPTAQTAGREEEEGHVGAIRMALVPEVLADEQFWQRYLFHRDMIEAADTKRKLLLQGEWSRSRHSAHTNAHSLAGAGVQRRLQLGRRGRRRRVQGVREGEARAPRERHADRQGRQDARCRHCSCSSARRYQGRRARRHRCARRARVQVVGRHVAPRLGGEL